MNLTLNVWRQRNAQDKGHFLEYQAKDIGPDMSFLEMLDQMNEDLIKQGSEPVAFDSDCREGICGMCSLVINGVPHGAQFQSGSAACIGCGACVAACKNASAMLFVAAKVSHLALLPQGKPEAEGRVRSMVAKMDEEGFGNCTNQYECQAACPKKISVDYIALMNREYLKAVVKG